MATTDARGWPRSSCPTSGCPAREPALPAGAVRARGSSGLRARADARGYDRLVVYADREHSANLVVPDRVRPALRGGAARRRAGRPSRRSSSATSAGGRPGAAPLPMRRHLFQDFSLPEPAARPLAAAGRDPGGRGHRRRAAASGSSAGSRTPTGRGWRSPAFLVDELRGLVGPGGLVENANDLLIDPADGLRVINDVDQLAAFEYASCQTSEGVRRLLRGLRPGHDRGARRSRLLGWNGTPLSCHLMLTAGPRATFGLLSPGDRPIERGDPFTTAFGIWGALDLPRGLGGRGRGRAAGRHRGLRRAPRRRPTSRRSPSGTSALRVGQTGRRAPGDHRPPAGRPVLRHLPQPGPPAPPRRVGQLAGLARLRRSSSGRAWRCRSTSSRPPARRSSRPTSRTAIALADDVAPGGVGGRAIRTPGRGSRRAGAFMRDALGIELHPDVLPLSNLAGGAAAVPAPPGPRDDARILTVSRVARLPDRGTLAILRRSKYR